MTDVWANPKRFEKAFSEDDRRRVYEYLNQPGWETGWKSNSRRDAYTFLHKHFAGWRKVGDGKPEVYECQDELQKNSPLIYDAWLSVRDKIFAGHKLVRCYANAMCYGMDGTVHTDSTDPGNYTAVYYPHERWSPNWGGETMFYNKEENRILACFYPRPNSVVVFDGRIPHRANGVTRAYAGMRITLMFKVEKLDELKQETPNAAV
jgi:SM-20-related protein